MPDLYAALIEQWGDTAGMLDDPAMWEKPKRKPLVVAKGHCKKCGKHIGRGVVFHEKACNG